MKVIGYKRNDFSGDRGITVTGYNIYLTYPLSGADTAGEASERIYMTDTKLAQCGYLLKVGDEVSVTYTRQGKPAAIVSVKH